MLDILRGNENGKYKKRLYCYSSTLRVRLKEGMQLNDNLQMQNHRKRLVSKFTTGLRKTDREKKKKSKKKRKRRQRRR